MVFMRMYREGEDGKTVVTEDNVVGNPFSLRHL